MAVVTPHCMGELLFRPCSALRGTITITRSRPLVLVAETGGVNAPGCAAQCGLLKECAFSCFPFGLFERGDPADRY